jgi:tRNA(Glu) U13 pseudouridine synthase TruD
VLAAEALTLDSFRLASKSLSPAGERRPVRVLPAGLASQPLPLPSGTDLRLTFTLPAGAYATTLLREVMKAPEPSPAAASGAQDRESAHG